MTKAEFLSSLQIKLCGLPSDEVREHVTFYGEMIDDRVEEGLSEEAAVSAIGSVDMIASQIIRQLPLGAKEKEKESKKRRLGAKNTILIILGSPLWISLAAAVLAILISLYACLWSIVVSAFAIFVSVALSAPLALVPGIVNLACGEALLGSTLISSALVFAGVAIFVFFGSVYAAKYAAKLSAASFTGLRRLFTK